MSEQVGGRASRGLFAVGLAMSALLVGLAPPSRAAVPERPVAPNVATVGAFADGFRIESRTTYALDPPAGAVHVALDVTITNQTPDQVTGGVVRQLFLPDFSVPVLAEAIGLRAGKKDGTELPVRAEPTDSPRFSFAVIDLRPDLYHPSSQTFRFTYDLPRQPPRSESFTRVNDAYATFPMLALGDSGLAEVELLVPEGFEVELVGDEMTESARDGQQVFAATAIEDPDAWEVLVSARDDSQLIERVIDVGEEDVKVLGWPDDPEWADFAATQVTDGVPVLEDLIGLDWPATSTIDVVETASPYLYGYAGWYMPVESLIEVGDELDQHVILHELSHLWFNDDLFEGRWINEAFADQVSAMAVAGLGGEAPAPLPIDPADAGLLKLNDWSNPDLQAGVSGDQERYGYNASWSVLHAVVAEIGAERLTAVIEAADAGQVAYRGPGVPEELARTFDWKELLDLLEELGGSAQAAVLFEQHVVGEADAADFAARAVARQHYDELLAAGSGWAAPTSVRLAMTDWRFEAAETLMTEASQILTTKAAVVQATAGLGVSTDLALRGTYEAGKDLGDVVEIADQALAAAAALGDAIDAEAADPGPIDRLGLLLSSPDDDLADARAAFDDGDYAEVQSLSADVEATMDQATSAGAVRSIALVVLIGAPIAVRRALRARSGRRSTPGASETDGAEGVGGPPDDRREVGV